MLPRAVGRGTRLVTRRVVPRGLAATLNTTLGSVWLARNRRGRTLWWHVVEEVTDLAVTVVDCTGGCRTRALA